MVQIFLRTVFKVVGLTAGSVLGEAAMGLL